jgi:hypothetical protein
MAEALVTFWARSGRPTGRGHGLLAQVGDVRAESINVDHRPDVAKRGPQCGDLLREIQLNHVGQAYRAELRVSGQASVSPQA